MMSITIFAQGCQSGTHLILEVHTLNYHFLQKYCVYTQLDGYAIISLISTRLYSFQLQKLEGLLEADSKQEILSPGCN